jgi:hypothetical protein
MESLSILPRTAKRFWTKVDRSGDCWLWTAAIDSKGYGRICQREHGMQKGLSAHRVSYVLAHGSIPADKFIDHICRNRACVNPAHLRLATHKQNMENRDGAQRNNRTSPYRGVTWSNHAKRWRADVTHQSKQHHLGYFDTAELAHEAAVAKRNEFYTHNAADRKGVA